jgi:hypothetical protein
MNEYITYKEYIFENESSDLNHFCKKNNLAGTEVFFDDIVNRTQKLYNNGAEKTALVNRLEQLHVGRLHCSYWAYPTGFLTKNNFAELISRFGGAEKTREYYGDLTGKHVWERWAREYEIASLLNAQAYTFHLIDYAPIDGEWAFTIPVKDIRQAMIFMTQQFLETLEESNLLTESSPSIEIENAGWGLEYGTQLKSDYVLLFQQIYDPKNKVKIGWDINHILHAIGTKTGGETACFMLPEEEKNSEMRAIESQYGSKPDVFALKWLEYNILAEELRQKAGSIHLSDCALKKVEYFIRGKLQPPYCDELDALSMWEAKEEYGTRIVLDHYDSHIPLQSGVLKGRDIKAMLMELYSYNKDFVVLHELKNSESIQADLDKQKAALNWG